MIREQRLVETFVDLADTLVDEYDIIDFMQTLAERGVELLNVSTAGIMLVDSDGNLRHAACSSEEMRLVEFFELQVEEGPCFDAFREAQAILCNTAADAAARWPRFAPHAATSGFVAVSAVPMRLRSQVIGALNLFSSHEGALDEVDLRVAQAMADIATIGVLHERVVRDTRDFSAQLEFALESRIAIEQAKGIVAERNRVSVDKAFELIRRYTRDQNQLLSLTARKIIDGSLPPDTLARETRRAR